MSRRFTNTSRAGLCLLGTADQRVHETIVAEVEQALGPAHAAIFAEPEYLHRTASSDWYSSVQGVITPLKDMVEADAVRTRQRLKGMFGDIARHADALNNSRSDRDRHLGTALEQAIRYPSEASVFGAVQADGSIQPIVVDWACEPDVNSRAESTLSGTVAALPGDAGSGTPADPEPVAARAAVTWWWALVPMWLAAAGLAATLAWLLIAPCGLGLGPWANACPKQDIAHADALLRRRAVLEQQQADLSRRLAEADRACLPLPPPDPEMERRLEEAEAQRGDLEITLTWNNRSDLDLEVTCPDGEGNIYYGNKEACRGKLDVDRNVGTVLTNHPVEHVVFQNPVPGTYTVRVRLYKHRSSSDQHDFVLRIKSASYNETFSGSVAPWRRIWTHTMTIPARGP